MSARYNKVKATILKETEIWKMIAINKTHMIRPHDLCRSMRTKAINFHAKVVLNAGSTCIFRYKSHESILSKTIFFGLNINFPFNRQTKFF